MTFFILCFLGTGVAPNALESMEWAILARQFSRQSGRPGSQIWHSVHRLVPLRTRWPHGPACRSPHHTNRCPGGNWGLHRAASPPTGLGLLPTTADYSAFGPHSQDRIEMNDSARKTRRRLSPEPRLHTRLPMIQFSRVATAGEHAVFFPSCSLVPSRIESNVLSCGPSRHLAGAAASPYSL